jgi:hypothetical protein
MGEQQTSHGGGTDGGTDGEGALDDADAAFVEHPWVELTSHPAACRMLRALLDAQGMDLNKSDLAEMADVGRRTVHNNIDLLVSLGLVEETRTTSGAQMYALRDAEDAPVVEAFINFHDALAS